MENLNFEEIDDCELFIDILQKNIEKLKDVDLRNIIDICDLELLNNSRIINMSKIDWGKTCSISNQYIHKNILKYCLRNEINYSVFSTDDKDNPFNEKNNSPGYDLLVISPNGEKIKIQSKLRQVNGSYCYSRQINIETTRRNSKKNKELNHTGHVCYSMNEFDFIMVSLVHITDENKRIEVIKNCNLWNFCIVPIKYLYDSEHNCCSSFINSTVLQSNNTIKF